MLAAKVLCNMPSTSAAPVAYAAIRRRSRETGVLIYAVEMLTMQLFSFHANRIAAFAALINSNCIHAEQ
jgi:hypothetical protein